MQNVKGRFSTSADAEAKLTKGLHAPKSLQKT